MNIRELQLFKHLSETLHFGKTSRSCNITPSALTRMIQRLENELDENLFVRDNRTVKLTPAGEAFRRYADDVVNRWSELQNDLASDGRLRGVISIYGSVTAVYSILPNILKQYRKIYPEVKINLETGDAAKALTKLQNGDVDISVAAIPKNYASGLEIMKIIDTPLVFIAPKDFSDIDWKSTPLIIADQGLSRERFDKWLISQNVVPNIYAQVAGNEAIIAMVSLGCGVGVIPELVLKTSPLKNDIKILNVSPKLTPFSIGICTLKKNMPDPKIEAFWNIASGDKR